MAEYASFCTGCNTFQFTPWGVRRCPSCGAVIIQSRVNRAAFESLSSREKYMTFLPLVREGTPESEVLNAGIESHEEVRKIQQQREEEVIHKELEKKEMLTTAAFSPAGFRVIRQCGCVFSDQSFLIPAYLGLMDESRGGHPLSRTIENLRNKALDELLDQALDRGGNALIGLHFDYLRVQLQDNCEVCVSAQAEAAVIEKIEECESAGNEIQPQALTHTETGI